MICLEMCIHAHSSSLIWLHFSFQQELAVEKG
jgi:hypothetical protein